MDGLICSIHALIACFSWQNLYLDGGVSYQDSDFPHQEWITRVHHLPGVTETVSQFEMVDDAYNPYGRISLGLEVPFRSMTLSAEAFYSGSMDDKGAPAVKGFTVKARWYFLRR